MPGNVRNPLFTADWLDVIFVHFRVDAAKLQPLVPLPLDLHEGDAYVSLVAFTQSNLRPAIGGRLGTFLAAPLAHHAFLNVRTYVRPCEGDGGGDGIDGGRGIFVLAEWIPNRLAAFIGPRTYGLPYRLGRLDYDGTRRDIGAAGRRLTFELRSMGASTMHSQRPAALRPSPRAADAAGCVGEAPMPQVSAAALEDFLLERYTAFTSRNGITRRFDVEHVPWPQRRVGIDLIETSLLPFSRDWFDGVRLVAAHHSPGVRDVLIGPPRRVLRASPPPHARG